MADLVFKSRAGCLYLFLCSVCLQALICQSALAQDEPTYVGGALSLNPNPISVDLFDFGELQFHALATGIGMAQTNPAPGDFNSLVDISNAQIIAQKNSGLVQFYIQSGYYSTPSLGTTYQRASMQTMDSFGLLPLANISLAPLKGWLFTAGKINSFGGFENTFTYQNANIDRGLLWNQTSNVSRGLQASYQEGGTSVAATLNDGFYSNQLSWMGASVNHRLNERNNVGVVWAGSIRANSTDTFITPKELNNSQIVNAIYTYNTHRWSVTPYLQYTYIPSNPSIGIPASAQTYGAAILSTYRFLSPDLSGASLPFRLEYISSAGKNNMNSPNVLYGVGSSAWSATITPTYQFERVFIRGEISYVRAINTAQGQAFGPQGNSANQTRVMLETGILY